MTTTKWTQGGSSSVSAEPAIRVEGLTKRFGRRVAVDRLDLEIPSGVVAGFIGPNGAGKTTTMAMLLGLAKPTAGTGTVLGHPLEAPGRFLGHVGALIEAPAFWPGLTGIENLRVLAELGGHGASGIPEVLDLVDLAERGGDRFRSYSFGMKQRLGIAAALLGDPELLLLDEPTNGLDPAGINDMRRLIERIARDGRTVLVSSHILSELEQICDWLIMIDEGALVYQGAARSFLDQAVPTIAVEPEHPGDIGTLLGVARDEGLTVERDGRRLLVEVDGPGARTTAVALNRAAMSHGVVLAELHVHRPSLESHYLTRVQGGIR